MTRWKGSPDTSSHAQSALAQIMIEETNSNEDILIGIFDLVGRKMQNELNELPFGVYIVKYEGKSVKIIKH